MPKIRHFAFNVILVLTVAATTSCGVSPAAVVEPDYCKPITKIIASYTDLLVRTQDDEAAYTKGVLEIVSKLQDIAGKMKTGKVKNFVLILAKDYKELAPNNYNMEAISGLSVDLYSKNMALICPQMYP